jgi:hypothetical protein
MYIEGAHRKQRQCGTQALIAMLAAIPTSGRWLRQALLSERLATASSEQPGSPEQLTL